MWSLGVILYILLCGYPPFQHEQQSKLFKQILKADFQFHSPWWDNVSSEGSAHNARRSCSWLTSVSAKDMVSKLLVVDPAARLTPLEALKHPFMVGQTSRLPIPQDMWADLE